MKILIVFDTYSGGTLEAAKFITNKLTEKGHEITMKRADEITLDEFTSPELIIFGTPSWFVDNVEGKPHEHFVKLMDTMKNSTLQKKNIAIFGLGDESYAYFCGGVTILEKFLKEKQGTIVIESLKLDSYYANQEPCHEKITTWINKLPLS